jgi:hypothetical protein
LLSPDEKKPPEGGLRKAEGCYACSAFFVIIALTLAGLKSGGNWHGVAGITKSLSF